MKVSIAQLLVLLPLSLCQATLASEKLAVQVDNKPWPRVEPSKLRNPSTPLSAGAVKATAVALVLQSVFISNARKHAVINGRVLREGERINGHRIVKIDAAGVVLKNPAGGGHFIANPVAANTQVIRSQSKT